jgi:hypothetical protein
MKVFKERKAPAGDGRFFRRGSAAVSGATEKGERDADKSAGGSAETDGAPLAPRGLPDTGEERLPAEERLRRFTRGRVRMSRGAAEGAGPDGASADLDRRPESAVRAAEADADPESPFVARSRLSRRRSAPRRIWDLEADEDAAPTDRDGDGLDRKEEDARSLHPPEPAPGASRPLETAPPGEDEVIAYARAQVARIADAGMADGCEAAGGRAKTRLLGFQSRDFAARDPFSQRSSAAREGPMFPVGWLVVTKGPGRGASFALTAGVASIGRGADQTVCLDFGDTAISRSVHASIAYDPETDGFFLGAGARSNLVRCNDRPVLATEELADGDAIRIGETTLRFVALCGPRFSWAGAGAGEKAGDA